MKLIKFCIAKFLHFKKHAFELHTRCFCFVFLSFSYKHLIYKLNLELL
jgi:hypothetical protein